MGKPSWFVDLKIVKPRTGGFWIHGKFSTGKVIKPTGSYNTGKYESREPWHPGHYGKYWEGNYKKKDVPKPRDKAEFFLPGTFQKPPAEVEDPDPWGNYYFSFELDDIEVAQFLECSGIKTAAQTFEIEEGGVNWNTHKRPGISKWENITLKRAVHKSDLFVEWRDYYLQPPGDNGWDRRANTSAAIVVRNNAGKELRRYTILQPWPVSWEGPSLSGGGSELAVETLEIAHSGILIDQKAPKPEPIPPPEPKKPELKPVNFRFDKPKDPVEERGYTQDGKDNLEHDKDEIKEHDIQLVWVDAHTCDLGSHSYNLGLSKRRALSVKYDLEKDETTKVVRADGYSYDFPKVPNVSGSRATNRRADIWQEERPMGDDNKPAPRPGESKYDHSKPKAPR